MTFMIPQFNPRSSFVSTLLDTITIYISRYNNLHQKSLL